MFVFSMVSLGFFQHFLYSAFVVWVLVLIASGIALRHYLWSKPGEAWLILVMAPALWLVFFIGEAIEFFITYYLPFYWIPFALGLLIGGIRIKGRRQPA